MDNTPENDNDDALKRDSLKDVGILNNPETKFGIPNVQFIAGILLTIVFSVMLRWWTGGIFGLIYFTSMYEIHKEDPDALGGWIKAAIRKREDTWTTGLHKKRDIYLIDNRSMKP